MPVLKYRDPASGEWLPLPGGGSDPIVIPFTVTAAVSTTALRHDLGRQPVPCDLYNGNWEQVEGEIVCVDPFTVEITLSGVAAPMDFYAVIG